VFFFFDESYGCLLQGKAKDIELKGHTDSVDQLCWDPKHADLIATASGDKTVRLWDARSKQNSLYSIYYNKRFSVISSGLSKVNNFN
jgi:WD40 repeat protein